MVEMVVGYERQPMRRDENVTNGSEQDDSSMVHQDIMYW
jgi:hypothetical protein